jgi:hypothetical protein
MNNVDVATCRLVDDYLTTMCQIKVGPHCSCIVVISIIERNTFGYMYTIDVCIYYVRKVHPLFVTSGYW